ncbi:hypothetical protein OsI_15189 [Oryza sativa Indica Group]|uniref:Uncharacterized protein n=1 Tax=Oryza sativa subsp. indica TaxID=39946 RepID=B8AS02_ORYSI|nr:hypothetical protein OsI_15189 [Oryza sativa Indica Group]
MPANRSTTGGPRRTACSTTPLPLVLRCSACCRGCCCCVWRPGGCPVPVAGTGTGTGEIYTRVRGWGGWRSIFSAAGVGTGWSHPTGAAPLPSLTMSDGHIVQVRYGDTGAGLGRSGWSWRSHPGCSEVAPAHVVHRPSTMVQVRHRVRLRAQLLVPPLSLASTGQVHPLSPQTTPTMREKRKGEKMAKREGNRLTDM